MDCKKALNETNGDLAAAADWLRTKGIAKADKKASRVAAEGLVAVALDGTTGALVEVNSETDFVARNDGFQAAVTEVAQLALAANSNEDLASAKTASGDDVTEFFKKLVGKIGENMAFRRMAKVSVSDGVVAGYIHNAVADGMGKIGVLVALESSGDKAKERTMLKAEAIESGKPESIVDKMVEGRMQKFFKESVLLTQIFVMDGERTVAKVIEDEAAALGTDVKMTAYVRMGLGEVLSPASD